MSRGPPRRSGGSRFRMLIVLGVALLLVTGAIPTSSFTSATVPRDASIEVASDENAVLGLDIPDDPLTYSRWFVRGDLVTITNRLNTDLTVTITVQSLLGRIRDETETEYSRTTSVNLAAGAPTTIEFRYFILFGGNSVRFDVEAESEGIAIEAPDRTRTWSSISSPGLSGAAAPRDVTRTAVLEDVNRTDVPQEISRTGVPQDINRTDVPQDVNRTGVPQDVNRTGVPQDSTPTEVPDENGSLIQS